MDKKELRMLQALKKHIENPFHRSSNMPSVGRILSGELVAMAMELSMLYTDEHDELPPLVKFRLDRLLSIEEMSDNPKHPVFCDKSCVPFFNPDAPFDLLRVLQLRKLGRIFPAVIFNPEYWVNAGYHYRMEQTNVDWEANERVLSALVEHLIRSSLSVDSDQLVDEQSIEECFSLSVMHEGTRVGKMEVALKLDMQMLQGSPDVFEIIYSVADTKTHNFHVAMRLAFSVANFIELGPLLNKLREFFANGWRTANSWDKGS